MCVVYVVVTKAVLFIPISVSISFSVYAVFSLLQHFLPLNAGFTRASRFCRESSRLPFHNFSFFPIMFFLLASIKKNAISKKATGFCKGICAASMFILHSMMSSALIAAQLCT
ncbi:hypothetical protein BX070DRAFT_220573 [Coemansia spiralis]|nr:hypothetical protein BX070DRAFT_220573 [Coemansia spiralis]